MEYKAGDKVEFLENHSGYRKGSIITITGINRRTSEGKIIYTFRGPYGDSFILDKRIKLITPSPKFKVGETVWVIGNSGVMGGGTPYRLVLPDRQIVEVETSVDYHERGTYYNTKPHAGRTVREQDLELVKAKVYKEFDSKKHIIQKEEAMRLVSIFVYDAGCPAGKAMVHKDTEVLTNDTNEILRHEVKKVVIGKLATHNAKRVKLKDDKGDELEKVGMDDLVIGIEEHPLRTSSA